MMNRTLPAALALAALLGAALPAAATSVGVSVEISQPGVYGRVDIGRFPQPTVVVQQPVVIAPAPRVVVAAPPEPVYLWVPPGHQRKWRHHCSRYNACGVPVYFVQDRWYRQNVMAGHDGRRGHERGEGRGHGKGHKHGHDKHRD